MKVARGHVHNSCGEIPCPQLLMCYHVLNVPCATEIISELFHSLGMETQPDSRILLLEQFSSEVK